MNTSRHRAAEPLPAPVQIGGHPALDFLNSIANLAGGPVEWLHDGAALAEWLLQTGAIDAETAALYRSPRFTRSALDKTAARARELRDWLRAFVGRHAGKPLSNRVLDDLEPLNRLLAANYTYRQVERQPEAAGAGRSHPLLHMKETHPWDSAERLLQPIADNIGDLICHAEFQYIRACEGEGCTLIFYDTTRGRARRWCSMAMCGNRHKAAAHRARLRKV